MLYLKQIGYTGDVTVPVKTKDGVERVSTTLTKELFGSMVEKFRYFQKHEIAVPVTTKHRTSLLEDTIGYVKALWEGKDRQGRDSLYCAIEFNEEPDANILNAGASLETSALYTIATTGEVLPHPLVAVAVTPTPVLPGMESFSLALSITSACGENTDAPTNEPKMEKQLAELVLNFLGIDSTQYEGKDTELIEMIASSLAALKQSAPEEVAEAAPDATQTADGSPQTAEESTEEKDEKDEKIEELTLSLNRMRQEARMVKLNNLASQGKLSKPAFDKAKAMYGGDLALSRDAEFNQFVGIIESNAPAVNTQSLSSAQVLPQYKAEADPVAKAQEAKYAKKK